MSEGKDNDVKNTVSRIKDLQKKHRVIDKRRRKKGSETNTSNRVEDIVRRIRTLDAKTKKTQQQRAELKHLKELLSLLSIDAHTLDGLHLSEIFAKIRKIKLAPRGGGGGAAFSRKHLDLIDVSPSQHHQTPALGARIKSLDFIIQKTPGAQTVQAVLGFGDLATAGSVVKTGADAGEVTKYLVDNYKFGGSIYFRATEEWDPGPPVIAGLPWATTVYLHEGFDVFVPWTFMGPGNKGPYMAADITMFAAAETTLSQDASAGATRIYVNSVANFVVGESIYIAGVAGDRMRIGAIGVDYLDLTSGLGSDRSTGDPVQVKPFGFVFFNFYAEGVVGTYPNSQFAKFPLGSWDSVYWRLALLSFNIGIESYGGTNEHLTDFIIEYCKTNAIKGDIRWITDGKFWENGELDSCIFLSGSAAYTLLDNLEFTNEKGHVIRLQGTGRQKIMNCLFKWSKNVGTTNTKSCIYIENNYPNPRTKVANNHVLGASGVYEPKYFIEALMDSKHLMDWQILNNSFENIGTSPFNTLLHYYFGASDELIIRGNQGFNPYGLMSTPFYKPSGAAYRCISPFANQAAPSSGHEYYVSAVDVWILSSGGDQTTITIKDKSGNTVETITGSPAVINVPRFLPVGFKITWGTFTSAPTVTIWGN